MNTKRILVTGANGQLGREIGKLAENFQAFDFVLTDIDELDITDVAACRAMAAKVQPFCLINCAAYTAVDKAETDVELARKLNVAAVENLVAASRSVDAYFVQISTDYVFDGAACTPYEETSPTAPQSEYGRGKLEGEHIALAYDKTIVVRTAWLYSTFGNNFVKTMLRLGTNKPSLNVVCDQVGTPTYAEDLAVTLLQIMENVAIGNKRFVPGVFHYSNEGVCSWYDFAHAIMKIKGLECAVKPIATKDYPTPASRPAFSVLNKSKIKETYNIEINHWITSLEKMLNSLD